LWQPNILATTAFLVAVINGIVLTQCIAYTKYLVSIAENSDATKEKLS